jgi:hydrogenase nickel incorporation protein HypA/HybF
MHELSLATALVGQLERLCEAQGPARVVSVRLRLGALSGVDREAFVFAFPLAAEGTCAAGAKLVFEELPAEVTCEACGARSAVAGVALRCGACGSDRVQLVAGREFETVSAELQTD